MKIAVVCANGKAGQLIVKEALSRGLDVTAVVRVGNRTEASQVIQKDLYDLTAAFVFGDHLGFTAGVNQAMVTPVIVGKLVAGITALIVANILAPKLLSKIESTKVEA